MTAPEDDSDLPTAHSPIPAEAGGGIEARIAARVQPESLDEDHLIVRARRTPFLGAPRPLVGNIVLLRSIGRGGMGVVYLGVNPRLGNLVALKVLPPNATRQDPGLVKRFFREARIAVDLDSPHIVRVLDVDHDDRCGLYFLVMEYVEGTTASHLAKRRDGTLMREHEALDIVIAATRGLVAAHLRGVIHRDIKPANILVPMISGHPAQLSAAKLADLGLARPEAPEQALTLTEVALGTPGYIAPEQVRDAKGARKPADVFSMGCTLYSLLSGRAPFRGSSSMDAMLKCMSGDYPEISTVRAGVSPSTRRLIECCLETDPSKRYCDASALLKALEICRHALDGATTGPIDMTTEIVELLSASEQGEKVRSQTAATDRTSDPPPAASSAPPVPHPTAQPEFAPSYPGSDAPTEVTVRSPAGARGSTPLWLGAAGIAVCAFAGWAIWGGSSTGTLRVLGLPDGAVVEVRALTAPHELHTAESSGGLVEMDELATGSWEVRWTAAGFESGTRVVDVDGRFSLEPELVPQGAAPTSSTTDPAATSGRDPDQATPPPTGPAVVSVTVTPPSAEIRIDDVVVGKSGLDEHSLEPGEYELSAHAPGFVSWQRRIELAAGGRLVLPAIELQRVPMADLSALSEGTEVWHEGRRVRQDDTLPLGEVRLELRREGYAPVIRTPSLEPGGIWTAAAPNWADYQAVLEIRGLRPGVSVEVDGIEREPPLTFPEGGETRVLLRSGNGETRELVERLTLGGRHAVRLEADDPLFLARLVLPNTVEGVSFRWNDAAVLPGALVAPGAGVLVAARPGFELQTYRLTLEEAASTTVELRPFVPVTDEAAEARALLSSAQSWDQASTPAREATAKWIAAQLDDFTFGGIDRVDVGGRQREIVWFRHVGTNLGFALISGTPAFRAAAGPSSVQLEPFLISRTEVTRSAWARYMPALPGQDPATDGDAPQHSLTWHEATEFCELAGLALPTEAQWEYAARAGSTHPFVAPVDQLHRYAHYDAFSWEGAVPAPLPVAWSPGGARSAREPNGFGLFDVQGNVSEWCADEYTTDPSRPGRAGDGLRQGTGVDARVFRGGSYADTTDILRFDERQQAASGASGADRGLRPIRRLNDILR